MTQEKAILNHLKHGKSITPLQALRWFGSLRLGARIWDLKRMGYNILTEIVKTETGKHVAKYSLRRGA